MVTTTADVEREKAENAQLEQDKLELEFLRYFYGAVDSSLGPASDDVYQIIMDEYEGELPKSYTESE